MYSHKTQLFLFDIVMLRAVPFQRQKHVLIFVMNILCVDDLKMSLYIQFIKRQGNYIFCIQSTNFIHLLIFCQLFLLLHFKNFVPLSLSLTDNLYHFIVRFSTSAKRKQIFWVKRWNGKLIKTLLLF